MPVPMELSRIIISEQNEQVIYLKEIGGADFPHIHRLLRGQQNPPEGEGGAFARPLTDDLIVNVVEQLGGEFQDVLISELKDHTYFARLRVRHQGELVEIERWAVGRDRGGVDVQPAAADFRQRGRFE